MSRNCYNNRVEIRNVPKGLIKQSDSRCYMRFKYGESSSGYAHINVEKQDIKDTPNAKFYNIILDNNKKYRLQYEISKGRYVSQEKSAFEIKDLFELSRTSESSIKNRQKKQNREQDLVLTRTSELDDMWLSF